MTHRQVVTLLGVLATVVLFGLPLFIELGVKELGNDEAIYSYAVDRMLEGEDWLTPRSIPQTVTPGDPATRAGEFFEKPPLKFWIVALPIRLGLLPHDAFGLRFWDALFGAVAFVYVFLIGRRLVDPLCGLAAVFLLFIDRALLFSHGLRTNVMEAPLERPPIGPMATYLCVRRMVHPRLHDQVRGGHLSAGGGRGHGPLSVGVAPATSCRSLALDDRGG